MKDFDFVEAGLLALKSVSILVLCQCRDLKNMEQIHQFYV